MGQMWLENGNVVATYLKDFWLEKHCVLNSPVDYMVNTMMNCWPGAMFSYSTSTLVASSTWSSPTMDTTQQTIKLPLKKNRQTGELLSPFKNKSAHNWVIVTAHL